MTTPDSQSILKQNLDIQPAQQAVEAQLAGQRSARIPDSASPDLTSPDSARLEQADFNPDSNGMPEAQDSSGSVRINARPNDVLDIFNLKHYSGANPYLDTAAVTYDISLTHERDPLPIERYISGVGHRFPHLRRNHYFSLAHLFGRVVAEVNQLDMDLPLERWILKLYPDWVRLANQTLHGKTTRAVIYCVWDWFEAISQGQDFDINARILGLQQMFRESVYGGPTVYALLRTAQNRGIPTQYLWDENLIQYGYGRRQVRGSGTTFDRDSHIDSDFTTRKDDCKAFLETMGFPVPQGKVVGSLLQALRGAEQIGYPVVVKPVAGHKGIGVTANVQDPAELEFAYDKALDAIPRDKPVSIIVEKHVVGTDFRILCVNGQFVAAIERTPASVIGDGLSTIGELIERENATPARLDTPTSPLGKIQSDDSMQAFLAEQGLNLDSVLPWGQVVYLRKVANLSAGGVSRDATRTLHPDNVRLAEDIARYFRLTCLGIDVISPSLTQSWQAGSLGIIEINAAPGIFMHLKPAVGERVDVPAAILSTFFASPDQARIPIISFNRLSLSALQTVMAQVLTRHPRWLVGGACREGILLNQTLQPPSSCRYNTCVRQLLRHPHLDLLVAEYPEERLKEDGMAYQGSDMVILLDPTEMEMMLARGALDTATVIIKKGQQISVRSGDVMDQFDLENEDSFERLYLQEMAHLLH